MAKDITCTQVVVNKAVLDCNAEENIEFKFSFDIKIKLTEEITEEFDKKIKEAEDKVKPELDKKKDELEKKKEEIEQKVKDVENKIKQELDSKKNELDSKKNELDSKIKEAMDKTSPELDKKKKELDEEIKKSGDKIPSELAKKKEELDRKIEESKSKIESELDRKKEELSEKINDETKKEIEKIDEIKKNIEDTKKGIEEKTKEIEGLNKKKKEVEDEIQKKEKEKDNIEGGIKKIEDQLTKDKEDIDKEKKDKIANIPNLIEPILDAIKVNLLIDESVVVKDIRTIQKPLKTVLASTTTATDAEATTELVFPEALAGARLKINYAFEYTSIADVRKVNIAAGVESNIDIKRAGGAVEKIEKVYWADQEYPLWDAILSHRSEIFINETGFLHIYTKGLFGKDIVPKIETSAHELEVTPNKKMRDNMLSIPYSMKDLLVRYKKRVDPKFKGDTIPLTANVSTTVQTSELPPNPIPDKNSDPLNLNCKKNSSNPQKPSGVPPVKVNITTDEEALGERTKAKCIVQFRPKDSYDGEYGFDWIRIGDTNKTGVIPPIHPNAQVPWDPVAVDFATAGSHNDFAFEDYMGKHYRTATMQVETDGNKAGNAFKRDKDPNTSTDPNPVNDSKTGSLDTTFGNGKMYRKFKHRFRRLLFDWNPQPATPGDANSQSETYTPIMTIMKGVKAELDLYLDIKDKPKGLHFLFNNAKANSYFEIKLNGKKINLDINKLNIEDKKTIHLTTDLAATLDATTQKSITDKTKHKLTIKCEKEFNGECTLKVLALKEDDTSTIPKTVDRKGEVCGMLRILPNAKMYQRKIEVLFIKVKTNINGRLKTGKCPPEGLKKFKNVLGQALVIPQIIDLTISTIAPKNSTNKSINFINECCDTTVAPIVIENTLNNGKDITMGEYFLRELSEINSKYKDYLKIFFLDETSNSTTAGYSWDAQFNTPYVVCFDSVKNDRTLAAHEVLHSLGLHHPFDSHNKNTPFNNHFCTTDNVMDYTNMEKKTLYYWHWQIINTKLP